MSVQEYYNVAGHCFSMRLRQPLPMDNYRPFVSPAATVLFSLEEVAALPSLKLEAVALPPTQDDDAAHIALSVAQWDDGSGFLFELAPHFQAPTAAQLLVDRDRQRGWIVIHDERERRFAVDSSLMLLYAHFSADHNTLLMHASTVVRNGFGYLFLGVSGTGKSTHSRLWMQALDGVTLLNDDNPVLRIDANGAVRVYGTPWSGKTPCYLNQNAHVGGIVDLEQAPYNEIQRLSLPEGYAAILSSASGLKADCHTADGMHETLSLLLRQVPCWHLRCLPNHDAARLCHSTISAAAPMLTEAKVMPNAVLLTVVASMLREGKEVTLATKGYSMLPFIRGDRDSVVLRRHENYAVDDVVLAEVAPRCYVLHRIVRLEGDQVTLAGDGNLQGTEHCRTVDIAGRAEAIVGPQNRRRKIETARCWKKLPRRVRWLILGIMRRLLYRKEPGKPMGS